MSLKSFAYYDLIDACASDGCPMCRLLRRDVSRLLSSILYEYSTDRTMQGRFRASRGLCAEHGTQLLESDNALAIAVLYEQSLHELLELLGRGAPTEQGRRGFGRLFASGAGSGIADALEPTQTCIACETRAANEAMLVRAFMDDLRDEKLLAAFRGSSGLCAAHLRLALRQADSATLPLLTGIQHSIWTRLRAELNEFMRKNDFNHKDEAMGSEADSWQRAVRIVSGDNDSSKKS